MIKPLQHFKKAIQLNKIIGDYRSLGTNYNMYAGTFHLLKQYDSTLVYYDKAEKAYSKANYVEGSISCNDE